MGDSNILAALYRENRRHKAEVATAREGVMSSYLAEVPLKIGDLLPSQRQRTAVQFRRSSYEMFAKLQRDGFIVLELPTVDKDRLSSAHLSFKSYRCKAPFEGCFLSARNLPSRHVLEFNAGASAVLVNQELPAEEDGWTQAHQTEASEAMHALKVATTSVMDAISFATGIGVNTVRHQLLEEDVPLAGETLSSSILHVVSYAPGSHAEAMEFATRDEHMDAGLLTAVYCPTPGLEVQVPPRPKRPGQPTHQQRDQAEQWTAVPSGPNTIVVMVGYTLEHATAGVLRATIHRVWPRVSRPCRTALAFKLRARSTANLPRGLMLVDSYTECPQEEVDEANTVSALMRTFRQTHGPSLNGAPLMSAPEGQKQVRRRMDAEVWDCRVRAGIRDYYTQIFVKTHIGANLTLTFETLLSTVLELKQRLQQETGVPMARMRLIFAGNQLFDDYKTLAHYDVQRDSLIHMVLRLCGD